MRRECLEILRLEILDDGDWEFGLAGEGVWFSTVIRTVSEFLAHESVCIVAIIRLFSCNFIMLKITCPRQGRPAYSCDCRMRVSRFASDKVTWGIEYGPFYFADDE